MSGGRMRRPRIVVPGLVLLLELVACFGAPVLAPYQPEQADFTATLGGPSLHHLLGTDQLGRDVLSRLMYGGAVMFREMAIAVIVTMVIAVPLGLVAGLRRGRVDAALMRLADVVMSIPGIILLLIVLALFSQSMTAVMLAIGLLGSAVIIEQLFGLPGLGSVAVTAASNGDLPVILGVAMYFTLIVIALNLLLDLAIGWLNPQAVAA